MLTITFGAVLNTAVKLITDAGNNGLVYFIMMCALLILLILIFYWLIANGYLLYQRPPAYQKYYKPKMVFA